MTKLFEVQESLYKRLSESEDLNNAITGIHDAVPDKSAFPYIVLGRVLSTPYETKTSTGERIQQDIDIWSASKGKKETTNIIRLIESALSEDLAIDGVFLLSQKVISREVLEEVIDLYHGILTIEILIDLE